MNRRPILVLLAIVSSAAGCGGTSQPPDPRAGALATCRAAPVSASKCSVTFNGAVSGTADCTEIDATGASGTWTLDLLQAPSYPSANLSVTLPTAPSGPVTLALSDVSFGLAQVNRDASTLWLAAGPANARGYLSVEITSVTGEFHGVAAGTLVAGPGATGTVDFCAHF